MKLRLLFLVGTFHCITVDAQPSISPSESKSFCPGNVITFTVSVTGNLSDIVPKALNVAPSVIRQPYNIVYSNGVTTFNFDGRFEDVNNKQTFQLNYKYGPNNRDTIHDFTFIKIKSLTLLGDGSPNDCSKIQPSLSVINAPLCQAGSISLSYPKISYINSVEIPKVCYDTVHNYEYLLPSGWSIGASVSNGSDWIAGSNSVTINYDANNGIGE